MRHDFCNGKYTVMFDEKTGELGALRYGEPWRHLTGDGLVLAMLQEVDTLRENMRQAHARIAMYSNIVNGRYGK